MKLFNSPAFCFPIPIKPITIRSLGLVFAAHMDDGRINGAPATTVDLIKFLRFDSLSMIKN